MIRSLVCALATLLSTQVQAQQVIVHTVSWHTEKGYLDPSGQSVPFNNSNYGIGYRTEHNWSFGTYRNSNWTQSVYIAKSWTVWGPVGVVGGLVTGYKEQSGRSINPFAGIEITVPIVDRINGYIVVLPPVGSDNAGAVHLSVGYKF